MIAATFWLKQNCARHPRVSGGVVVLLRYLNAWLQERQDSCTLEEFRAVLEEEHLEIVEVAGVLLVPGMGLKEDVKYVMRRKRK